ncbi:MAG: non-hydrolyzing UDP-N-acetylglucosamine 2-epimerase [Rhodothermales bacterium]
MNRPLRVCSVVGARPQFIKAAVVGRALAEAGVEETLVHTGQHYDATMSRVFFDELGLAQPAVNLEVGSSSHAEQTGTMMVRLEEVLLQPLRPDWVVVYGDTNSTLAAALVAAKLHLPLAHVEAGLRSFSRTMPEEINRIVADRLADLLFCPTRTAVENLRREGIEQGVHLTGDVMLDAVRLFSGRAAESAPLSALTPHEARSYYLATVHRAENTDDTARLRGIFDGLGRLDAPVLMPLHPRTRGCLGAVVVPPNVELIEPVGYLAMLTLVRHARLVLTDSGGLQKETFWLGVPCVTLREETEWVETLDHGWNQLVGCDPDRIRAAAHQLPSGPQRAFGVPSQGTASETIVRALLHVSP